MTTNQRKLEIDPLVYIEITNSHCNKGTLTIESDFIYCDDVALMNAYLFASLCKKWAYEKRGHEISSVYTDGKYCSYVFDKRLIMDFEPQEFSSNINEFLPVIQCAEFLLKGDCVN